MHTAAAVALSLVGALERAQGQAAAIDTLAIAKVVGAAIGREAMYAGPYILDTTGAGARFSIAAIQASGLQVALSSSASPPVCQFYPTKKNPESPYLFSLVFDTVTSKRTVVWSEMACDQGARGGYWLRIRYVLRWQNGHWRVLPGRQVMVT